MGVVTRLEEEQDFWQGKVVELKWGLYLQTRKQQGFAEEVTDVELPWERRGWPRGWQRGLAQGCAVKLTHCRAAKGWKWPEFGWGWGS